MEIIFILMDYAVGAEAFLLEMVEPKPDDQCISPEYLPMGDVEPGVLLCMPLLLLLMDDRGKCARIRTLR